MLKAPDPVRSPQLSNIWTSQYYGGGPHGNTGCCSFCFTLFLYFCWNFKSLLYLGSVLVFPKCKIIYYFCSRIKQVDKNNLIWGKNVPILVQNAQNDLHFKDTAACSSNSYLLPHNITLLFALLVTIQIHWVIYTARNKLMNDLEQFMACDITVIAYMSAKYPIIR